MIGFAPRTKACGILSECIRMRTSEALKSTDIPSWDDNNKSPRPSLLVVVLQCSASEEVKNGAFPSLRGRDACRDSDGAQSHLPVAFPFSPRGRKVGRYVL